MLVRFGSEFYLTFFGVLLKCTFRKGLERCWIESLIINQIVKQILVTVTEREKTIDRISDSLIMWHENQSGT